MQKLKGIGASEGISKAKVYLLVDNTPTVEKTTITDAAAEVARLNDSIKLGQVQIEALKEGAMQKLGAEKAAIFDAHIQILTDPEISGQVIAMIESEKVNASYA